MIILAIDTTSVHCKIGIWRNEEIFIKTVPAEKRQIEAVFPLLDALLKCAEVDRDDLDVLTMPLGPGPFTGVRVGATICRAIATALNIEIVGISSLKAIAATASRHSKQKKIAVATDAKRGELYFGAYVFSQEMQLVETTVSDRVLKPTDLLLPATGNWAKAGAAWGLYKEMLPLVSRKYKDTGIAEAEIFDILQLAASDIRSGSKQSSTTPAYLRDPVN